MIEYVPDLWKASGKSDLPLRFDPRPVMGVMAPFVGHHYTMEEIWRFRQNYREIHKEEEKQLQPLAARIRAFDVPCLARTQLMVNRLGDLSETLSGLLLSHLSGWVWESQQSQWQRFHLAGPIKKYGILHTILRAPDDATTRQPMVLELFGRVSTLNGQSAGKQWFRPFQQPDQTQEASLFLGDVCLLLERATYANTRFPGIGVPFYL